ncbi:MAG: 7TM-DISM domain-containing protein, partial [Spirochaetota bacterium]
MHRIYTGKTYLISILYLLLAFCQTIFATERHILELKQEKDKYNATPYFQYLEDKKHSIKREDILNGNLDKEFLPYENKNINFGFSRSTFWFRLKLKYISRSEAVLLEIPWPHLDYIDVYISGKEQILAYKSGRLMPYKDRIYPHKNFIFEIPYDPDELVIYIKVRSDETLIFPIHIFDKS